jgi:uracil-DNA glycosylase
LLGKAFRVTHRRGELIDLGSSPLFMATVHPSSILRISNREERALEVQLLADDLRQASEYMRQAVAA